MVRIGLEVHCQLATQSKLFCNCPTQPAKPNQNVCPICLGLPGSKPKLNERALQFGIKAAIALNCQLNRTFCFSRKSYFYPDLSKNYQITQYELPLAWSGFLRFKGKQVKIKRVHLEEDPARIVHTSVNGTKYTLLDYNRSGIPLLEIVTEPDFQNGKEVRQFLEELSSILEHLEIFDPNREGAMRVDVNISAGGGQRVEIKNVTGFKEVERVISFEIARQEHLLKLGMSIAMETRYWDPLTKSTLPARKKEVEEEYGYIFDPDLPRVELSEELIKSIKQSLPELPEARVQRMKAEYGISEAEARVMVYKEKALADFFENCCKLYPNRSKLAHWVVVDLLKCLNWHKISIKQSKVTPSGFVALLCMIDRGEISERLAKEVVKEYVNTGIEPEVLVKQVGKVIADEAILKSVVEEVISEHSEAFKEFKAGKERALHFLVGKVLEKTNKRADPNVVRRLLAQVAQ